MTGAAMNIKPRGNNINGMDSVLSLPRACVMRNTGLSIASNTGTYIAWDLLDYDTDGMFDQSQPTRLTCRTSGLYQVDADMQWAANNVSIRLAQIQKNRVVLYNAEQLTPNIQGLTDPQAVRNQVYMNAGDYVELYVLQATGSPVPFQGATTSSRVNGLSACLISLP